MPHEPVYRADGTGRDMHCVTQARPVHDPPKYIPYTFKKEFTKKPAQQG